MPSNWKRAIDEATEKIQAVLASDRESVGVVFSPHRTNEENYVLAKLVSQTWKVDRLYMGGNAPRPERADDRLRTADVSPNRRGVKAILGSAEIGGLAVLEDDILGGDLKGLIVLGHELPLGDEALAKAKELDCLVVLADREQGIAKRAHVTLPTAAWAEHAGSLTNVDGRVQRMQAAYEPMGQSLPAWRILCDLGRACGSTMSYDSAEAVFKEMVGAVDAFSGAEWGRDTLPIQLRFAHSRG
jgi:predicted molibdopterin-dependent oxidoreductase YjgC